MQGSKRSQKNKQKKAYKDRNKTKGRRGKPNRRFLIVCEGTETEPNYFEALGRKIKNKVNLDIRREGKVSLSLVKRAKTLMDEDESYEINKNDSESGDEVWCIFDRDIKEENNNQKNFNEAIILACNNNINLAVSNDAFELWFLLHFSDYSSQTHRSNYESMLTSKMGRKYDKKDPQLYRIFESRQTQAIENSARIWESQDREIVNCTDKIDKLIKKHNINPSTTVYLLVNKLIQYL